MINNQNLQVTPHESSPFKELLKAAMPYTLSSFVLIGGNFVGVIFISRLGPEALAASNLTSAIQNLFTSTIGTAVGSASILARRKIASVENKKHEVGTVLHKSWLFSLGLGVPALAVMLASEPILLLLKQDPAVVQLTKDYFYGYTWGLPAMFMLSCNRKIALATDNAMISLYFIIGYQVLDTALSYALVTGNCYLPKLGFAGLSYSNSITSWMTFLSFTGYMAFSERFKKYGILRFDAHKFTHRLWRLIKLGLPMGIKVAAELGALLYASLLIGAMGADQQAAQEAAYQYIFVLSTPMFGIMDTVSTFVSGAVKENNLSKAKRLGYLGMGANVVVSLLGLGLFMSIPDILLDTFLDSSESNYDSILATAKLLLLINGLGQIVDSIRNTALGGLNGFLDSFIPTLLLVLTIAVINLPLSYVLGFTVDMKAPGVMIARDIGITVGAAILLVRWWAKTQGDRAAPAAEQSTEKTPLLSTTKSNHRYKGCLSLWPCFFNKQDPKQRPQPVDIQVDHEQAEDGRTLRLSN